MRTPVPALREIQPHVMTVPRLRRLLEEIFDDAFDVDPFILEDFPFYAYYELGAPGGDGIGPGGAPVWWPMNIYQVVKDHPFWQGKYPHELPADLKKRKKRPRSISPLAKDVSAKEIKITGRLAAHRKLQERLTRTQDEADLLELILVGEL